MFRAVQRMRGLSLCYKNLTIWGVYMRAACSLQILIKGLYLARSKKNSLKSYMDPCKNHLKSYMDPFSSVLPGASSGWMGLGLADFTV